jgi:hypothetical protein
MQLKGMIYLIMGWKKTAVWVGIGLGLVFIQSFWLVSWLTWLWAIVLSWRQDEPWLLILAVGLATDLFLLQPLGQTVLIIIGISLITKWLKRIFGLGKSVQVKVNHF